MEYLNKIFNDVITIKDLIKIDNDNGYYFADNFLSNFFKLCDMYNEKENKDKLIAMASIANKYFKCFKNGLDEVSIISGDTPEVIKELIISQYHKEQSKKLLGNEQIDKEDCSLISVLNS